MSRKDYQAFADMFNDLSSGLRFDFIVGAAKIFKRDNPLFKPAKFAEACGLRYEDVCRLVAEV